ncbi:hypothetical protein DVH24_002856 [Malus domestica]|uniref:Uncharacterized protein n=1 Tax=Malus domestica TaxID=3750 RepID=A0A498K5V2_MALDO|nr:hypothetical protein DVH24_002856 [Malus domestica]
MTLLETTVSCCRSNAGESDLIITASRLPFISGTRNSCRMPRIVTVSTRVFEIKPQLRGCDMWVRRVILQPLQGVHASRKISARKIPRNSSSCSVIDISTMSLSILRYLTLASIFGLKCIIIYLSLLGFIQFNRGGVRKWLQNWNFQYLGKGKQEENTNSGDDGESLLCSGNRRSMCNIQRIL